VVLLFVVDAGTTVVTAGALVTVTAAFVLLVWASAELEYRRTIARTTAMEYAMKDFILLIVFG
jgi:dephospho-CoA kinase